MKAMIYTTAATITLVTANFAFAGNCETHSVEKVKCEMGNKTWMRQQVLVAIPQPSSNPRPLKIRTRRAFGGFLYLGKFLHSRSDKIRAC